MPEGGSLGCHTIFPSAVLRNPYSNIRVTWFNRSDNEILVEQPMINFT